MNLEFHEIADIFPMMDGPEFEQLRADIKARGLIEPLWLYQDKILDGRNRYRACRDLGIEPAVRVWNDADPIGFVVSLNLRRRHLNESQRALVASRLAKLGRGQRKSDSSIDLSQEEAAEKMSVGVASVKRARHVEEKAAPTLVKAVEAGKVSVAAAAAVADLPEPEQRAIVAKGPEAVREKAAEIRKGKSKVNGVLADDPPDVARARAAGKIAADVVVEVTEPGPAPAEAEAEAPEPEDAALGDEEWLDALPLSSKLAGACLRKFRLDALLYRALEPARGTFQHHAARALAAARRKGGANGAYGYRVSTFLKINHPKHWHLCPRPEDGGCAGEGTVGVIGQCPRCKGRGYWIL